MAEQATLRRPRADLTQLGRASRTDRFATPLPAPIELSPSDAVILTNLPWAREELNGVVRRQFRGTPASAYTIVRPAMLAAFTANLLAGAVRLASFEQRRRTLFGTRTKQVLKVARGTVARPWPNHSLEARICGAARDCWVPVADLIYDLIGTTSCDPDRDVLERWLNRMVRGSRLQEERVQRRFLGVFTYTTTHYVLQETEALEVALREVQRPVTKVEPPEIARLLDAEVSTGFRRRTQTEG